MSEFEDFIADLLSAAPEVGEEMRRAGVPLEPDMEIAVSWVGRVGDGVVAAFDRLGEGERRQVFAVIEHRLVSGSERLRTALATGLLEVVSEAVNRGRLDGATVAGLLGHQSRAYIDAWDQHSLGRSSLDPS